MNPSINEAENGVVTEEESGTSYQLQRSRCSANLYAANSIEPWKRAVNVPSHKALDTVNPTELFSDYILQAQAQTLGDHAISSRKTDPKRGPALDSPKTSLVAMIHGFFVAHASSLESGSKHFDTKGEVQRSTTYPHPSEATYRGSGGTQEIRTCTDEMQQTRGIPIQRRSCPCSSSDAAEIVSTEGCEQTYDWATWRMYNRITEHRARYPVSASYLETAFGPRSRFSRHPGPLPHSNDLLTCAEPHLMEGEIFSLEL